MNLYEKLNNILLLLFILLSPILPTYGKLNSDLIIYMLLFLQIIGFIFIKNERNQTITNFKKILKDKMFLTLIFLNIIMYTSAFVALDKRISITHSIRFSFYLFIFYVISYKITTKKNIKIVLNTFIFTSGLIGIITLIQVITIKLTGDNIDLFHRVSSTLENPNNLGAYSIFSIFICIMLLINSKERVSKNIYGGLVILLLSNIIISQSRNALLALILGVLLISILYDKRYIIFSAILPIILFIIPQSRVRLLGIFDFSQNSSRIKIWKITEIMIKNKHELFGIGYENFGLNYPIYVNSNPDYFVRESLQAVHPHNIFLKFQVELGIFGTIAFIAFLIVSMFTLYKLINSTDDKFSKSIFIGITISFLVFQFMNLIDSYYGSPKVIISMFIILGIANSYKHIKKSNYYSAL